MFVFCLLEDLRKARQKRQQYLESSSIEDSDESEDGTTNNNKRKSPSPVNNELPIPTTSIITNDLNQNEQLNLNFNPGGPSNSENGNSQNVITIMRTENSGKQEVVVK